MVKRTWPMWFWWWSVRTTAPSVWGVYSDPSSQGSVGWTTVLGWSPPLHFQESVVHVHGCSLSNESCLQVEISHSSSLSRKQRMDVQDGLYFCMTMVLPILSQMPAKLILDNLVTLLFWGADWKCFIFKSCSHTSTKWGLLENQNKMCVCIYI